MSRPLEGLITDEVYDSVYKNFPFVDIKEATEVKKFYKISICTNVMDRLRDLKETYIKNIEDNLDYPNVEFVLLDYGSKVDDVDSWVKENLMGYIKSGKVVYFSTKDPKYYSMTHSRNIAISCATGDIVNTVDADHFINKGFATRINKLANQVPGKIMFVKSNRSNRGRIGMFKKDFLALGGYDEQLIGYGFDDKDLLARGVKMGYKLIAYGGDYFSLAPNHSRHEGNSYEMPSWRYTQGRNALMSIFHIYYKQYVANQGKAWGVANVRKNFEEFDCSKLSR